jgi:hypothetical protein
VTVAADTAQATRVRVPEVATIGDFVGCRIHAATTISINSNSSILRPGAVHEVSGG